MGRIHPGWEVPELPRQPQPLDEDKSLLQRQALGDIARTASLSRDVEKGFVALRARWVRGGPGHPPRVQGRSWKGEGRALERGNEHRQDWGKGEGTRSHPSGKGAAEGWN